MAQREAPGDDHQHLAEVNADKRRHRHSRQGVVARHTDNGKAQEADETSGRDSTGGLLRGEQLGWITPFEVYGEDHMPLHGDP